MSLGDKLKKTIDELEAAGIRSAAAQANADLAAIRLARAEKARYIDSLKQKIVEAINAGRVPSIKEENYAHQTWIKAAKSGKGDFHNMWDEFVREMGQEKLKVVVSDAHDGVGMRDWLVITVVPSDIVINYRGGDGPARPAPPSTSYGKPFMK